MMVENKDRIIAAAAADLGKVHQQETTVSEWNMIVGEIDEALHHLHSWMQVTRVYTPIAAQPARSYIRHDPLGVVLVVAPWNYPVNLALAPLIGSIAGGNCTFIKLSRHSPETAKCLGELIPEYLDMRYHAVEGAGGASFLTSLFKNQFDHIFFTGSVSVGKIVAEAAAKYLTPVTLELGGKNPVIVEKSVDIELAASRIAWGKFFNAGQTCLGVDYVLCERSIMPAFLEAIKRKITQFYGEDPQTSESFPRIISSHHAERLTKLFKDGTVYVGGTSDPSKKYVAPTVLTDVKLDSVCMQDEIFGPVMPVIPVDDVSEAVEFINQRPHPLALYVFSGDRRVQKFVMDRTRSGAVLLNEVLLHFANSELPFGGVGDSGIGAYHGKRTFNRLTHARAVIAGTHRSWLDLPLRYPPYNGLYFALVDFFTRCGW
eukprot:TRINITY_DN399_c0_g1_i5.p1 TRINITY_DN399_c0_g1~~TRINITY_DN399_c0_g1_i5.p1  ORF type:complete len:430 (+),score=137.62 TRINITY_DN399_c0_g1_i5:324-1613(+)